MKLTIRTNPEIVIELESIREEREVEPTIAVPDVKVAPDVKGKVEGKTEGRVRLSGTATNAVRTDNVRIIAQAERRRTMKDKIRDLADEGLSSDEVADRLGLSLAVVNKYWQ